jgi:hypothetical protein|tara:strand:+ start:65 stop:250 length:186 start_codon:yes stop_codon:yes gene_type:complete
MYYDKYYQSEEWVNIQIEMEEDENSGSIMDEFNKCEMCQEVMTKCDFDYCDICPDCLDEDN